jgi:O-antigen ligase
VTFEPSRRTCEIMLWLILFFAPAAFGCTEWWSRAVLESLIFLLAALCALRRDFSAPMGFPLLAFLWVVLIGFAQLLKPQTVIDPAGLMPLTISRPQTLYALLLWTALAALLWATTGILRWEGALRRLCWAIFLIGVFIAIVGILQRGQGNTEYYGLRPVRHGQPFGPFTNYDHAATWLVASTFIGAGLFAAGLQRKRMPTSERFGQLTFIGFLLAIVLAGVFSTGSRGGINALFISGFVASFLAAGGVSRVRNQRLVRVGLVVAAGLYAVFLYFHPLWLGFVGGTLDASAAYRLSMYRSGVSMLADFPLFGVGLGCFTNAFHAYQERFLVGFVDHVHSSWLEISLEIGLVGIAVLSAMTAFIVASLGRGIARKEFAARAVGAGAFAALLAVGVHAFVEFTFQIPAGIVLFTVLTGVAASLVGAVTRPRGTTSGLLRFGLAGLFCALVPLSLPTGFDGLTPRLDAPFQTGAEQIAAGRPDHLPPLQIARAQFSRSPVEAGLRHQYGNALWNEGRVRDSAFFFATQTSSP